MNIDAYLHRIGYSGARTADAKTLQALHRAHMLTVPFENLDIHWKRPIELDESKFFEKIVLHRRGGFCYELNGLFAALLRELGYHVTLLNARVYSGDKPGPDFDHMALLVHTHERWLADVGFGDSFIEPLPLDDPGTQSQRGTDYRIQQEGDVRKVLERRPDAEWSAIYEFDLRPHRLEDYAGMCQWHQHSPESHFTQKRVCTRATPEGRVTLSEMKLITTGQDNRHEQIVQNDDEYFTILKTHFGVEKSEY